MTRRPRWPAPAALAAMLLPWLATAAVSLHALHEHEPGHLADPMHGHGHDEATPEHEHVLTPAPTPTARLLRVAGLDTAAPAAEAGAGPAALPVSLSWPRPQPTVSPPLRPALTSPILRI